MLEQSAMGQAQNSFELRTVDAYNDGAVFDGKNGVSSWSSTTFVLVTS